MEKILYPIIALTITKDWILLFENQHAKAIVIKAAPVSLQIKIAPGSVIEVPSNMETSTEGTKISANPVAPSKKAVVFSNDFIWIKFNYCYNWN